LSRYPLVSFCRKSKKDTAAIGAKLEISGFKRPFSWDVIVIIKLFCHFDEGEITLENP
jgi:hypothetical protein